MTLRLFAACLAILAAPAILAGQAKSNPPNPLMRHYKAGQTLRYQMDGTNDQWHYTIQADGVVTKNPGGGFFEEFRWSNLRSDHQPQPLSTASYDFRQRLSLDPNQNPSVPNLSAVDVKMVGPITDLLTFYVDLWLAVKTGQLIHAGDHFYYKKDTSNSWADGTYVLLGQDAIDFDFTLKSLNASDHTADLIIRHVPPQAPQISIPATWMQAPVADTANNWVQVTKIPGGKFTAAVGKETFDVEIKVSLEDGKILSGTLDNPVVGTQRDCDDAALTICGAPTPLTIHRRVLIALENP